MNFKKANKPLLINIEVPDIEIWVNDEIKYEIDTIINYEEFEDYIEIEFREFIPDIKRGLVCDFKVKWKARSYNNTVEARSFEIINDLLLVKINTRASLSEPTSRIYRFYKD